MEGIDENLNYGNKLGMKLEDYFKQAKTIFEEIEKISSFQLISIPRCYLKKLSEIIETIVKDPSLLEEHEDFKESFYDALDKGLIKNICSIISIDHAYQDMIEVILKQFIILFAKNICNKKFIKAMEPVFDYSYSLHQEDYKLSIVEEWRHKLKTGDRVECLKIEDQCKCWGVAIITFIYKDTLELQFENDVEIYDRSENRFSPAVAQFGIHSKEYNWKYELQIGDEVDCYDKYIQTWIPSTIVDLEKLIRPNDRPCICLKIGYRIFTPTGTQKDNEGNRYNGWDCGYDEWIPLLSPRITQLHDKALRQEYKGQKHENVIIDDRGDPKIKDAKDKIYAVLRPKLSTSTMLINCLNLFGSEGGFDKILNLMTSDNHPDLDLLKNLLSCFLSSIHMYHRDFIIKFAVDVKNSFKNEILNKSKFSIDYDISMIQGSIIPTLLNFLKRIYPAEKVSIEFECLKMNFMIPCIISDSKDQEHGLIKLYKILRKVNNENTIITPRIMYEWIKDNQVLSILFSKNDSFIKEKISSEQILIFYLEQGFLNDQEIDIFWASTKFSKNTKRGMLGIFIQYSRLMTTKHKTKFLQKLEEDTNEIIDNKVIEFVYKMGNSLLIGSKNTLNACRLIYKFILDKIQNIKLCEQAISNLGALLKLLKSDQIMPLLYDCLENLKNDFASVESIKIMKLILEILQKPENLDQIGKNYKSKNMKQLENEKINLEDKDMVSTKNQIDAFINKESLIDVILQNLMKYSQTTQNTIYEDWDKVKIMQYTFQGKYNHETNIHTRLEYLSCLPMYSSYKISFSELNNICDILLDQSQLEYDKEAAIHWLINCCSNHGVFSEILDMNDEKVQILLKQKIGYEDTFFDS